ncbi:MAG: glycosyltransferase, partial [Cyanobacteria bacterium]|nr:glycosyltransferase [Cyanobacteriota bacterium]
RRVILLRTLRVTSKSKVSIILPVFNGERYLAQAIESVLAQTHENFELVLSDNRSTDKSYQIARKYAKQDSRIKLSRNSENIGPVANFNKVIAESTGKYIELFSHDDLFEPTCIEKFATILDEHKNVVIVTSNRNSIDVNGDILPADRMSGTRVISGENAIKSNLDVLSNWISSPVMFRSKYKKDGFNVMLPLYSDIYYWCEMFLHGDLYYLDEVLFSYRYHATTNTSRFVRDMVFATDLLRLVDRFGPHMSCTDTADVRKLIVDKMFFWFNMGNENREHLLKPSEIDMTRNEQLTETERLELDVHDFRRAVCLTMMHSNELSKNHAAEREQWEDEKVKLLIEKYYLNAKLNRIQSLVSAI